MDSKHKIAELLIAARQSASLKQSDVGKIIGVKGNTISDWERCRTEPDIDTFIELCRVYKINPFGALQSIFTDVPVENIQLSPIELNIINMYRRLDNHSKELVYTILEKECLRHSDAAIDEELASYRRELEAEAKGAEKSSVLQKEKEA